MTDIQQAIINEIKAIPDPEIPVITIEELGILKRLVLKIIYLTLLLHQHTQDVQLCNI